MLSNIVKVLLLFFEELKYLYSRSALIHTSKIQHRSMRKLTSLIAITILLSLNAASQEEFGYNTTDLGAEYQWSPDANTYNFTVAFNAKLHSSFIFRGGYSNAGLQKTATHNGEEGSGFSGSIGYRYFIGVIPKRFYIGARFNLSMMKIHWSTSLTESDSKLTILQPALETGYTFLINEVFFITPYIAAGPQVILKKEGAAVDYGEGFQPLAGINMGFRF